jgi:hypothetical protein
VVPGDDGDSALISIHKPLQRYLRVEIDRSGANTAVSEIYALLYGPTEAPTSHGSTIDTDSAVSPALSS